VALQQGETIRIIALENDIIDNIYEDKMYYRDDGSMSLRSQRFFNIALDRLAEGKRVFLEMVKTPEEKNI
jgi:hypothetical protein